MSGIRKTIRVRAPASRVFSFLTEPRHLLEIWPNVAEITDVQRAPDGRHSFHWIHRIAGVPLRGRAETLRLTPNRYLELRSMGALQAGIRWSVLGRDELTDVRLEVEFDLPASLLGRFSATFLARVSEREVEALLGNLRDRLEVSRRLSRPSVTQL